MRKLPDGGVVIVRSHSRSKGKGSKGKGKSSNQGKTINRPISAVSSEDEQVAESRSVTVRSDDHS
eukprot:3662824-Amphidinium_carterae.1